MLENLYTTKMSGDKKTLYLRFASIRAGGRSGTWGAALLTLLLAAFLTGSLTLAACSSQEQADHLHDQTAAYSAQEQAHDLYDQAAAYLDQEFREVYRPYYDVQDLTISNWQQEGNQATFFYQMTYLHYNRDPDKAEYIRVLKESDPELYQQLYDEYLGLYESNYEFKVVRVGDQLELYSNIAPVGPAEWVPTQVSDYILPQSR